MDRGDVTGKPTARGSPADVIGRISRQVPLRAVAQPAVVQSYALALAVGPRRHVTRRHVDDVTDGAEVTSPN